MPSASTKHMIFEGNPHCIRPMRRVDLQIDYSWVTISAGCNLYNARYQLLADGVASAGPRTLCFTGPEILHDHNQKDVEFFMATYFEAQLMTVIDQMDVGLISGSQKNLWLDEDTAQKEPWAPAKYAKTAGGYFTVIKANDLAGKASDESLTVKEHSMKDIEFSNKPWPILQAYYPPFDSLPTMLSKARQEEQSQQPLPLPPRDKMSDYLEYAKYG